MDIDSLTTNTIAVPLHQNRTRGFKSNDILMYTKCLFYQGGILSKIIILPLLTCSNRICYSYRNFFDKSTQSSLSIFFFKFIFLNFQHQNMKEHVYLSTTQSQLYLFAFMQSCFYLFLAIVHLVDYSWDGDRNYNHMFRCSLFPHPSAVLSNTSDSFSECNHFVGHDLTHARLILHCIYKGIFDSLTLSSCIQVSK